MIKLIACDLDGTLLNRLMNMSPFTINTLHQCVDSGIIFLMATGRDYYMVIEYKENYNLHCDMILNNGAQYLSDDLKTNITYPIEHTQLRKIINILRKYDYHISMHTTNGKYIFEDPDTYYERHIAMIQKERGQNILEKTQAAFFRKDGFLRATHQIDSIDEMFAEGVEALKLDCKNPDFEAAYKGMSELKQLDHILLTSSYESYVEITADQSHKGKLLENICKKYGFSKDEVAVFGDSSNDLGMMELFPNCYCPANAQECIKAISKEVLESNEDDGIAKKLIEIMRENEMERQHFK